MSDTAESLFEVLCDAKLSIPERHRALFGLRNFDDQHEGMLKLCDALKDDAMATSDAEISALLKHEIAYALGQMGDTGANATLVAVLSDLNEHPMVRHEAGEALGAIGSEESVDALRRFAHDPAREVAETCTLALDRLEWLRTQPAGTKGNEESQHKSVDPAPHLLAGTVRSVDELRAVLGDRSRSLFDRYSAMFALRDEGSDEATLALCSVLGGHDDGESALLKHEVAFVLGQMANASAVPALKGELADERENVMVRHEAAEALGAIVESHRDREVFDFLQKYAAANEKSQIVRESARVALDIAEYFNSSEFEYAAVKK